MEVQLGDFQLTSLLPYLPYAGALELVQPVPRPRAVIGAMQQ